MADQKRDYYDVLGVQRGASEDDLKKATDEVQKLTDKYVAVADKKCQAKEKEIMDI